uniref:Uncharacterized protein n=1 Tax=Oryza rufipogon TaxID=4529 RepID=A0A0E0NXR9_ORYRU
MEKRNSTDCCFIINLQPPLAFVSHFASSPTVVQQELNLWPLPVAHATISDGSGGLHRASSAVGNQEDGGGHDMSPSQEIKDEWRKGDDQKGGTRGRQAMLGSRGAEAGENPNLEL